MVRKYTAAGNPYNEPPYTAAEEEELMAARSGPPVAWLRPTPSAAPLQTPSQSPRQPPPKTAATRRT